MVLVGVLPASTRGSEPSASKVVLVSLIIGRRCLFSEQDSASHGRGMNSSAFFSRRDSLNSVTASLVPKTGNVGGGDCHQCVGDTDLVLSGLAVEVLDVGFGQIVHEQFGVLPAFAGPNLDNHRRSSWLENSNRPIYSADGSELQIVHVGFEFFEGVKYS